MYTRFEERLQRLHADGCAALLRSGLKGIEKESLRVTPENRLSQRPHPRALGSSLTHPHITTDYSEAQLEFVTPPLAQAQDAIDFLHDIHEFVYANLEDELLWSTSMPCIVSGESSVPIARFGPSNVGRFKEVYRRGLEARYRRIMQIISGVHFNYSVPEAFWPVFQAHEGDDRPLSAFVADAYFAMARNIQRYDWLITYLFGCSPALCKSFMNGLPNAFAEFDRYTFYEEYATSLRLSNIGYKSQLPDVLRISFDDLDAYVRTLLRATRTPHPPYVKLGVIVDGDYRQLNANILQIENEFYGSARPKQPPRAGERPLAALADRGVAYLELRSLDVNAFQPHGVTEQQIHFLEAFMLFALLQESPLLDKGLVDELTHNQLLVAHGGRRPGLKLRRHGQETIMHDWANDILDRMALICEVLDADDPDRPYARALEAQRIAVRDPEQTPSAQVLREMGEHAETFFQFARRQSERHKAYFDARPASPERIAFFEELGAESWRKRADIEAKDAKDGVSFETYLENYFAQP